MELQAVEVNAFVAWNNEDFSTYQHHQYGARWQMLQYAINELARKDPDVFKITFFLTPSEVRPEELEKTLRNRSFPEPLRFLLKGEGEGPQTFLITTEHSLEDWKTVTDMLQPNDLLDVMVMGDYLVEERCETTGWIKLTVSLE